MIEVKVVFFYQNELHCVTLTQTCNIQVLVKNVRGEEKLHWGSMCESSWFKILVLSMFLQ